MDRSCCTQRRSNDQMSDAPRPTRVCGGGGSRSARTVCGRRLPARVQFHSKTRNRPKLSAVLHATTIDRSSERRATPDASRWRRRQSQRPYRERSALPSRECNRNSKTRNQSTPIGRAHAATIERSNERRATPDACRRRRWSVARPYRVRSALTSRECNRNSKTRYRSTPNGRTARSDDRSIS